jgi:tungstate transport system substrate-binding protein
MAPVQQSYESGKTCLSSLLYSANCFSTNRLLRNGGAGATGLIRALALDYLSSLSLSQLESGSITWVCNHSRNTQLALFHNYIDIALTYERSTEAIAETEGWSKTFGCVFHDHFVLAGPAADPAGVKGCGNINEALFKIWKLGTQGTEGVKWHVRTDGSATMWKERSLWVMTPERLQPWRDTKASETWYQMSVCTPAEAVQRADKTSAYLLTDRATLLRQTALGTVERTTVFSEPRAEDDVLMNSCFALYSPDKKRGGNEHVQRFLAYAVSERGQRLIERFGMEEVGVPFFAVVKDGFARSSLVRGVPTQGKWVAR